MIMNFNGFCPSEFPEEKVSKIVRKHLGHEGRLIHGSKSRYREMHPLHSIVFNANIFCGGLKIWYGDIDFDIDSDKLKNISKELCQNIYVVGEMEGRFGNEEGMTLEKLKEISLWDSECGLSKKMLECKEIRRKNYEEQKLLSLCDKCLCMTKKINGKCGKCGYKKRKRRKK